MNASSDLLKSLKIDRSAPPPPSRNGLWIALGVAAAVVLLVVVGWLLFARGKALEVQVAPVAAIGGGNGGAASVLDATGYVVARRMAIVLCRASRKPASAGAASRDAYPRACANASLPRSGRNGWSSSRMRRKRWW